MKGAIKMEIAIKILLWLTLICIWGLVIKSMIDTRKEFEDLSNIERELYQNLKKHLEKEIIIKQIIINSKLTKEMYCDTLEKIEKELFDKTNNSNPETKI